MKELFISFSSSQDMHDAKGILSNQGYISKECYIGSNVLEFNIEPEKEQQILETLDWYQIWVDTYDSIEEFLNR